AGRRERLWAGCRCRSRLPRPAVAEAEVAAARDRRDCRRGRRNGADPGTFSRHPRARRGARRGRHRHHELVRPQARAGAVVTVWHVVLLASIAVLAIKLVGYAVPPRIVERPTPARVSSLLTVALLAALVAVQTLAVGQS